MTDNARIVREALEHIHGIGSTSAMLSYEEGLHRAIQVAGGTLRFISVVEHEFDTLETELATAKAREAELTRALAEVQADLERAREVATSMLIAWDNATEAMGRFIKNNTKETAEAYMDALGPVAEAHSRARAALAPEQKGE